MLLGNLYLGIHMLAQRDNCDKYLAENGAAVRTAGVGYHVEAFSDRGPDKVQSWLKVPIETRRLHFQTDIREVLDWLSVSLRSRRRLCKNVNIVLLPTNFPHQMV